MPSRKSFIASLPRALAMIVLAMVVQELLFWARLFDEYENIAFDSMLLAADRGAYSPEVVLVRIDDADYRDLFDSTSPLDKRTLSTLIQAVERLRPRVIVVDILTSEQLKGAAALAVECAAPIVWALGGEMATDANPDGGLPRIKVDAAPPPPHFRSPCATTGLALLLPDHDGVIRRYPFHWQTAGPNSVRMESLAAAALRAYECNAPPGEDSSEYWPPPAELLLNFPGDRYTFSSFAARAVLEVAPNSAAGTLFKNRIVIIGGTFHEGRDLHATPAGLRHGMEILAHAIYSQLEGGGITTASQWAKVVVDFALGFTVFTVLFFAPGLRAALIVTLAIPLAALVSSFVVFKAYGYFWSFVPPTVGALVDRAMAGVEDYMELKQHRATCLREHAQLVERNERGSPPATQYEDDRFVSRFE